MATEPLPQLILPPEAEWGPTFDAARATDAYVATIPAAEREKSDAYFEGGYWIEAWGTLITVLIAWLLLRTRFSARLRDFAERRARRPFRQTLIYAALFLLVLSLLTLPWTLYTGFYREHHYGMSNQTLGAFLGDWSKSLALGTLLGALAIAVLYLIIRRVRERWVWWATGTTALFLLFMILIYPVFVAPLFNKYESLPPGEVRESILALSARENGVPADDVYWYDASKQTKRISANVRDRGHDPHRAQRQPAERQLPQEIRAVMAHEMGHYVLNHSLWRPLGLSLVFAIGFVNRLFGYFQSRHGERWGVRDLADPAGLPLALAIFSVVMLLLGPLNKSIIRVGENQAVRIRARGGARAAWVCERCHATGAVSQDRTGGARGDPVLRPPERRTRVARSMRWLAEHPPQTP